MFGFNFFKKKEQIVATNVRPFVLLILDGWGLAPPSDGNAIARAGSPNINKLMAEYPHGELIASGEAVGLPANEVGNTEVGHLTIGAGRIINQGLKRINIAITEGLFYDLPAFKHAVNHVQKSNSKLHIIGLIGSGQVHSSLNHLHALLQFCKNQELQGKVFLHLFTDGRDSGPNEAVDIIKTLLQYTERLHLGTIATISGRYYAMDRDGRWERTQKAYEAIIEAKGLYANSALEAVNNSYAKNITDEFIEPTVILANGKPTATIDDNDAAIFFNYRIDRPRQLTMALVMKDFEDLKGFQFGYVSDIERTSKVSFTKTFKRNRVVSNLFFVTMTQYQENIPVSEIAFPLEQVVNPLSFVISTNGLKQLHMAESEKERFVTYYFDGFRQFQSEGEDVIIVPSPHVSTYDRKPEMSIKSLINEFKNALSKGKYNFVVINFANADMVAHSGNLNATIRAVKKVDQITAEVVQTILEYNGIIFITADHGNAEELLNFPKSSFFFTTSEGTINTDHSNNPVPFIIVGNQFKGKQIPNVRGALCDIAPTILAIMNIQKPAEMTGKNLLQVDHEAEPLNL